MSFLDRFRLIGQELKNHSPFTLFGALTGVVFMLLFRQVGQGGAQTLFTIFHPLHVVLSAMVTASLFELHRKAKNFIVILLVGYFGSVGIATLSDSILPFFGETILGAAIPTHAALHEHAHEHAADADHEHCSESETDELHGHEESHEPKLHLGFIEEWWLVNPAAFLGILIAYFLPRTKIPHAGHILISTWASASHMLMNTQADMSAALLAGMLIVLFLAVWLPCCVSDIVFPLLFVKADGAHLGHHGCILCGKKDKENPSEPQHP